MCSTPSDHQLANDNASDNLPGISQLSCLRTDISKLGMILQLADGTIQACNPDAEKILGLNLNRMQAWTLDQWLGSMLQADGAAVSRETYPARVTLQTGQPCCDRVLRFSQPDGNSIWLLVDTQPLFLVGQSTPYAVVTTFADVTAEVATELSSPQQLAWDPGQWAKETAFPPREALFRLVFDAIPDTVILYDAERRFQLINPAGVARCGRSLDELRGRRDEDVWPAEITQGYLPTLLKTIETLTPQAVEHTFGRPETGEFTLLIKYIPLLDEHQNLNQILAFTLDITERKQIEDQMRILNDQLEQRVRERTQELVDAYRDVQLVSDRLVSIIEGSTDFIAALDLEFHFIAFNQAYQQEFQRIFGVEIKLGMSLVEALAQLPDEQAKAREIWERALRGEEFTVEREFGDETRNRSYYEITYSSIRDKDQNLIGASHIVRDVSQRRRVEGDLHQLNEDLERRVLQRTAELNVVNAQLLAEIRDRQRAEAELQQTATHLNFALSSAPITLYNQDLDLRYTWMYNPRHAYDIEQIMGRRDEDLVNADSAAILTQLKRQVIQQAQGVRQEIKISIGEQTYDYDLTVEPLRNDENEVIGVTGAAVEITQLKQIEEALYQSNAILNAINQFTPTLIYVKDRQGCMVMVNPALLTLVNRPEAAVIGHTSLEFHQPREAAEQIMANDRLVMETGQTHQFEEILDTPEGQCCFLSVKSPYRDEQGQVIGLIGISTEITDRKQTEALLKAHRAELQQQLAEIEAIYQSAPIGLAILSPDFRFLRINQRLAEINGVPVEAHLGQTVREVLPELADTAEQIVQSVLQTGEPLLNVEIRGETPAQPGVQRIWLEHFLPLKDDRDRVIGLSVVCEEVTEQRQAEEALRHSEERLRLAQQAARAGTWDWDIGSNTVIWSEEYYALYGLEPQVEPGFNVWLDCVYPSDRPLLEQKTLAALEHDTDISIVFRVLHPTGLRWFNAVGQIFRDAAGQPIRMTGITLDVTERKQAELEREELLERERHAREQAEQANRVKDEFLAVLSHELRTPLNPILGWSKLLQTSQFNEEKTRQALATIERNAKLQVQLIDDLLDISRILRGKLSLTLDPVSLFSVISAALETVRLAAETKQIRLEADLEPQVGLVRGDAGRLQQVVWNLLTNAIKFTPQGGQVTVRLEAVDTNAQITVSDTGRGINPDFLPYIFEYFRQEDSSTTRQFGGLGLGLAISRQLVEAHGGTIAAADSVPGQGATFIVRLPISPMVPEIPTTTNPSTVDLSGLRVLIVDDELDSRQLLESILLVEGAQVTAVASGAEVLAALARSPFDVLISDIGMPDMNGYTLLQQIRAASAPWRSIPAIALTAYASEDDRQRSRAAGYQQHLSKPIEPARLTAAVVAVKNGAKSPNSDA
ncbi:MAG: PAS domain-containing protein [Leptolyngbyaceae cyanobacterium bins.349]|nr:PAS domain-containing protein [Leptolyngbyaceae cyanobacterium bins.349]